MSSIFTKIIKKEVFCYKIYENNFCISFLDIHPIQIGHTLVVPKLEIDNLFSVPIEIYNQVMSTTYLIAQAIEKSIPCKKVSMVVLGMEVPHAHIHLIPINKESDLNFNNTKITIKSQEMKKIMKKISNFIS